MNHGHICLVKMTIKVLFFTDHEWSLGRLVQDLAKHIRKYDIDITLLSWQTYRNYPYYYINQLRNCFDWFVSSSGGTQVLYYDMGIPIDKCIEVLYHTTDINILTAKNGENNRIGLPAEVISKLGRLVTLEKRVLNIVNNMQDRIPKKILHLKAGQNVDTFYGEPSEQLKVLGFANRFATRDQTQEARQQQITDPWVFKRGYLAFESALNAGLNFTIADRTIQTNKTMPGWYKRIDALSCPSEDQGAGAPVCEAGIAGKLVITTEAGEFTSKITKAGAEVVPVEEKGFVEESTRILSYYKANPAKYRERCYSIREYAIKTYSWDNYIVDWVELFRT